MISIKSFTIGNFVEITIKPLGTHRLMALGFITSCHENQRILDDSSSPKDNNGDQEPIVMSQAATWLHWLQVINGESSIAMQVSCILSTDTCLSTESRPAPNDLTRPQASQPTPGHLRRLCYLCYQA